MQGADYLHAGDIVTRISSKMHSVSWVHASAERKETHAACQLNLCIHVSC